MQRCEGGQCFSLPVGQWVSSWLRKLCYLSLGERLLWRAGCSIFWCWVPALALGAFPVGAAVLWEMALASALLRAAAAEIVQAAPGMNGNEELSDWFGASLSLPSLAAPPVIWYAFLS